MKRTVLGVVLGMALAAAVAVAQQRGESLTQRAMPATVSLGAVAGSELIVAPALLGEKGQMLTVVDPRQRVLSVYHIDLNTGKITLKSARNIQWDLQVPDFNNASPTPKEIQSWLEQK